MTNPDDPTYYKVKKLFLKGMELKPGEERDTFFDETCGQDSQLRESLEELLTRNEEGSSVSADGTILESHEPAPDQTTTFVPGKVLADRYRIVSLLGRGGMGEVYRADDLTLEQSIALKFLPPALASDPSLLKALYNEVRQARRVSHRHVCRVYDIGEAEGLHFLTMEYIEGEDLGSLLRRIGRLPGGKAVELACQLCAGLEAAHKEGLLHLDLKPGNLMIDERGDLRVTDFGLAMLASEAEAAKRRSGTPAYMAPEQLLEGKASKGSDIYAVGLILYQMFTGRRMHGARSPEEIIAWHKAGGSTQLRSRPGPSLEPRIKAHILACSAPDPADRPQSVGAVLSDLESLDSVHTARIDAGGAELEVEVSLPPESLKDSDVFIAYAPVDDKPLVSGKPGWIGQFHDHLQVRLEQLSGESVKIWRDMSQRTQDSDSQLLEFLPSAKTMVSVISPPFIKTPACLREIEEFWQSAERSGNFRVSDKTRILKVMKTPVPKGLAPPDLERLMGQLAGFDFYETDPETGRVFPYDETFGDRALQLYFERVYDLAYEIRDVLQALRAAGGTITLTGEGKTVFLAETTADLQSERDNLKRELLENGHRVVPELPLPLTRAEFEKEAQLLLEESDFAVHLVGGSYGMVPEDTEESVVKLQNRLAADRSRSSGLERFIWMPRDVKPRDERQEFFVRSLIEDPETHFGAEVVQDSMENFKEMLLESLSPPPEESPALPAPKNVDAVSTIYLIYDRRDEAAVEPLEDLLFELGFEVTSPSFDGDEREVSQMHQYNLQHCDGVLVYYGSVSKPWVDMKLMDIAQAPGYGRSKDLLAKAVYVAPSDDRRKARFRTHLADVIRPTREQIETSLELDAFVAAVSKKGAE